MISVLPNNRYGRVFIYSYIHMYLHIAYSRMFESHATMTLYLFGYLRAEDPGASLVYRIQRLFFIIRSITFTQLILKITVVFQSMCMSPPPPPARSKLHFKCQQTVTQKLSNIVYCPGLLWYISTKRSSVLTQFANIWRKIM